MNILITGNTGFIGNNMFKFLEQFSSSEQSPNYEQQNNVNGYSRSNGQNIFDLKLLKKEIKNSDLVYHFAAYTNPAESVLNPVEVIKTNIKGTLNVLETCREYDTTLIYPSSCEIYGDIDYIDIDCEYIENSNIMTSEDFPIKPTNPYASSKAAVDRICYTYFKTYGLDVKIVRLFNPYGSNQQMNKIIPTFYSQAIKNEQITVFGNGSDTRDYVYIDDIVNGLWLSRKLPSGEAINLATGKSTTNLEVAKLIIELTKSNSKINFVDYPKIFGNIKKQSSSYKKAKKLIGWEPSIDLTEGIKRTIKWLEEVK